MPLEQYVTQVQIQLAAAAALGDDRTRATAETLATAAGPAIRLALMAAATSLADEITAVLQDAPGAPAVSVRLDGGDLGIEVRMSDAGEAAAEAATASPEDGENAARISLRLPDTLKVQIESAARQDRVSTNTWLLRAASAVLSGSRGNTKRAPGAETGPSHRVTGWING